MLKRKIGDHVNINPYYNTSGTIVASREQPDERYYMKYDYRIKWNDKMENGVGEWEYYDEDELNLLQKNWDNYFK